MSIVQMSFSGAAMILVILVFRAFALYKLPKKVFLLLWGIVLLRLLIPFSIPSAFSIYSLLTGSVPVQETLTETRIVPMQEIFTQTSAGSVITQVTTGYFDAEIGGHRYYNLSWASVWSTVWCAGMIVCASFFLIAYACCCLKFRTSVPVHNDVVSQWMKEHPLRRTVRIRQLGRISSPVSYGILRPVILMPKDTDWADKHKLQYILLHEYTHICHFDMVLKLLAVLALCVHWFNPMVWLLYLFFNRDIELACDECVVRQTEDAPRSAYAQALIALEEKKGGFMPLGSSFSKNAAEERVTAIMKTKEATLWTGMVSAVALIACAVFFATSADNGIHVPKAVMEAAEDWALRDYIRTRDYIGSQNADTYPWSNYTDWRIESLEHVYTYEDFDGMTLLVYQMNYEFLAEDPDNVLLAGGAYIDENGWGVPDYGNSRFLIFKKDGEVLSHLIDLFENDCRPGDEIFANDLRQMLNNG